MFSTLPRAFHPPWTGLQHALKILRMLNLHKSLNFVQMQCNFAEHHVALCLLIISIAILLGRYIHRWLEAVKGEDIPVLTYFEGPTGKG